MSDNKRRDAIRDFLANNDASHYVYTWQGETFTLKDILQESALLLRDGAERFRETILAKAAEKRKKNFPEPEV